MSETKIAILIKIAKHLEGIENALNRFHQNGIEIYGEIGERVFAETGYHRKDELSLLEQLKIEEDEEIDKDEYKEYDA